MLCLHLRKAWRLAFEIIGGYLYPLSRPCCRCSQPSFEVTNVEIEPRSYMFSNILDGSMKNEAGWGLGSRISAPDRWL